MSAPLSDVRVVEIASYVAAPAAGALLADLGADVVKVEIPRGEIYRYSAPRLAGYRSDCSESPQFHMDNRGKRSLVLDLSQPAARSALDRVIDGADVVLTNMLPRRLAKNRLDPDTLRKVIETARGVVFEDRHCPLENRSRASVPPSTKLACPC